MKWRQRRSPHIREGACTVSGSALCKQLASSLSSGQNLLDKTEALAIPGQACAVAGLALHIWGLMLLSEALFDSARQFAVQLVRLQNIEGNSSRSTT